VTDETSGRNEAKKKGPDDAWIRNWERVGPILEKFALGNIRKADTKEAIPALTRF